MMIRLKILVYWLLFPVSLIISLMKFILLTATSSKVVIFDLDNTLMDTAKELRNGKTSYQAWKHAEPIQAVLEKLQSYLNHGYKVVILSSRPFSKINVSKIWLLNNKVNTDLIIHTSFTTVKEVFYFFSLSKLIVFDDLSYNSENGDTKFFSSQIRRLKSSKNIEYFGFSDIEILRTRDGLNEN